MRMWGGILVAVLLGSVGVAHARPVSDATWTAYVTSLGARMPEADSDRFEDQFLLATRATASQDAAIADFARRLQLDPATAGAYAGLIVDTTVYYGQCGGDCHFAPGTPLYVEAERVAMAESSGRLLVFVGRQIDQFGRPVDSASVAQFIRLAWRHPVGDVVLGQMNQYTYRSYYKAAVLLRHLDDPVSQPVFRDGLWSSGDHSDGLMLALYDAVAARLPDTPEAEAWRVALDSDRLDDTTGLGLDDDVARIYQAMPQSRRDAVFAPWPADEHSTLCGAGGWGFDLAVHVAASLWRAGQHDAAVGLLQHVFPAGLKLEARTAASVNVMSDAMTPRLADADLFLPYVKGNAPAVDGDCANSGWDFSWYTAARGETPAGRELAATRLDAAGYTDMAWSLRPKLADTASFAQPAPLMQLLDVMPEDIRTGQAEWAQRITRAQMAYPPAAPAPVHVTLTTAKPAWTEKPLPQGVAAWQGEDYARPNIPEDLYPSGDVDVLRYDVSGEDADMVYSASDYGRGILGTAPGLWLVLRRDGVWQVPLYLGLHGNRPYTVTPSSQLPLIANGRVQMEVRIRDVDPDTIGIESDPGYLRQADGLYLDIALADLKGDSDGDGLTDIEEARMGLKPDTEDSDGDGMGDGADPLPLSAYAPPGDWRVTEALRLALLPRDGDTGQNGGAAGPKLGKTLMVVSDSPLLTAARSALVRLVVYSRPDIERLGRDQQFFAPQEMEIFRSPDGNRFYFDLSYIDYGWSWLITCGTDTCTRELVRDWSIDY